MRTSARASLYSFHESHSAEANSGFCSMKQLVVLISSPPPPSPPLLDGMLVHHRLPPQIFLRIPISLPILRYTSGLRQERDCEDYESEISHHKDTTQ